VPYVKKALIALVLIGVVVLLVTRGPIAPDDDRSRLRIGSTAEVSSLDPRIATDGASFERIYTIMEPLITYDTSLELQPRLATAWERADDGMSLTFELREGVSFHHGRPFTSDDVRYTFEWILDPDNRAQNRPLYTNIETIETPDDHTVIFRLNAPNAFLINNLARMPIVPADRGEAADFGRDPSGTGPFEFVSLRRDDRMIVRAFDDYWGGRSDIDELVFRAIPEDGARLLAFEAGELDLYQRDVVYRDIARLADDDRYVFEQTMGTGYLYLAFNVDVEPLGDVRVRRALAHLVDREGFVGQVLEGVGTPGVSMITPGTRWHNPDVPRFPYDPERARELLAEAGIEGEVRLRLHTNENPARVQLAEILQSTFAQAGVILDIRIEEFGAYLDRIQATDDYDVIIGGWLGQLDPDRAMYRQFHREGSANYMNYRNDRVSELLDRGRSLDPESDEALETYFEAQEIIVGEAPMAFVNYNLEVGLRYPWVEGWQVHPYSAAAFQDLHRVRITR